MPNKRDLNQDDLLKRFSAYLSEWAQSQDTITNSRTARVKQGCSIIQQKNNVNNVPKGSLQVSRGKETPGSESTIEQEACDLWLQHQNALLFPCSWIL